jgi:4-amino-4-deoxy-L-arabinose transferase-like glycosyltransferase
MNHQQLPVVSLDASNPHSEPSTYPAGDTLIAALLIGAGTFLRILSYLYSNNSGGDAWARVALTAQWLQHPTFQVVFDAYPPGHFWMIGLLHLVVPDVTTSGRLLSLILGIASLPVVLKLGRVLYGNESGIFALAVFAFFSLHIGYSATSSSEVCYLFFLLASLLYFFVGLSRGSAWQLGLSGAALSVAELTRLEAWSVFFGLSVIVLAYSWRAACRGVGTKAVIASVLAFGVFGAIAPVFMMVYCWVVFRNPMQVLSLHNTLVTESMQWRPVPLSHQLTVVPATLLITLSPLAFLAALYGLVKSFSWRLAAGFVALTLFFAFVQNYEIVTGKLLAMPRYSLTLGAMLAVISGYGLRQLCRRLGSRDLRRAQFVVIALLFANMSGILIASEVPSRFSEKFASISPRLRYSEHIAEVSGYLRTHMGLEDAVVIDDYRVESNIVAAAAGLPIVPGNRIYLAGRKNDLTARQYIAAAHPHFLVYADQGTLGSSFPLPPGCSGIQEIDGVRFHCTFAGQIYRVYELSYR